MVQTLGVNNFNDIYLAADGNIALLSNVEAVAGSCETISKSQLGEMIFSVTQGLPNFQSVWKGVPNLRIWQSYLQNALMNVPGVREVINLELIDINNALAYTATIRTQYGITEISG